ncbi:unnamed protein product, partial [Symbiodinium necroappetens]
MEADASMHMGLLFVALFGVFGDLARVKDEGSKMCFCVSDAIQFVQQKWHCAEIARLLGETASVFHTASACLRCMDVSTGDIPRLALPDMHVACEDHEPLDCDSWLEQSCAGINWKNRLRQLVMAFEFLQELCSDEHLDATWRKKIKAVRTIIQDVVFPMAVRVNLMIARGEHEALHACRHMRFTMECRAVSVDASFREPENEWLFMAYRQAHFARLPEKRQFENCLARLLEIHADMCAADDKQAWIKTEAAKVYEMLRRRRDKARVLRKRKANALRDDAPQGVKQELDSDKGLASDLDYEAEKAHEDAMADALEEPLFGPVVVDDSQGQCHNPLCSLGYAALALDIILCVAMHAAVAMLAAWLDRQNPLRGNALLWLCWIILWVAMRCCGYAAAWRSWKYYAPDAGDLVVFKGDSITDEIEETVNDDDLELNKEIMGVTMESNNPTFKALKSICGPKLLEKRKRKGPAAPAPEPGQKMDELETQPLGGSGRLPRPPDAPPFLGAIIADLESRATCIFDPTLQFKKQFRAHCKKMDGSTGADLLAARETEKADALGAVEPDDELDLEKELEKEMSQMDDDGEDEQYARQVLTESLKEKEPSASSGQASSGHATE